eukprot:EG_transcript_29582
MPQQTGSRKKRKLGFPVKCDEDLRNSLRPETMEEIRKVVPGLKRDAPGLVVEVPDANVLHRALGLPTSPIAQGANPDASLALFRGWLQAGATAAAGAGHLKGDAAWDHLTEKEAHDIAYNQWQRVDWVTDIQVAAFGVPARVLWLSGAGRGRADMFIAAQVFG